MSTNVVCDAYSGGCETVAPVLPSPALTETLPHTGGYITYGEVVLMAIALILVGVALVTMMRSRKA